MITETMLRRLWPRGDSKVPGLIAGIAAAAPTVFPKYGLNTDLLIAHAMAQFSHECGAGTEMTENVNYTAERAAQVWPLRANDKYAYRHFANAADCYAKCRSAPGDPDFHRKLINLVYGDRNGNHAGTDDGFNFIGRGLSQVTGRGNYSGLATRTGLDLVNHPDLVNSPSDALECGVADFVMCGCLPYALRDDVTGVTQKLNGGTIGLSERRIWLTKWKAELAAAPTQRVSPIASPASTPTPTPPSTAKLGTKAAGSVAAGTAAGYVAHQVGVPPELIAAIAVGVAITAFLVIHFSNKRS